MVSFTYEWFFITECIPWITAKSYGGADIKVVTMAMAIHRNPWVEAGI